MGDYVDGGFILDDDGNNVGIITQDKLMLHGVGKGGNSNTFNIDGTGYGTASATDLMEEL